MENRTTTSSEFSLGFILFIVFLVLKLTDNIDWSWWWVTSPLWLPLAIVCVLLILLGLGNVIFKRYF